MIIAEIVKKSYPIVLALNKKYYICTPNNYIWFGSSVG